MRINKLLIIATVIISIVLYACKHELPQPAIITPPGTPPGGSITTTVSCGGDPGFLLCFQSAVLPIFQTNCATSGCHDAISKKGGYVLDTYDNLFLKNGSLTNNNIRPHNSGNSDLYKVLNEKGNKKMPPNTDLTNAQKTLIAQWIDQGAFNTTCSNTPACDSNQFKFAANILPLLRMNCTGCHSGVNPPSGIDLTTYTNVKSLTTNGLNSLLYGVTAHLPGYNAMPKCPDPVNPNIVRKLPDCEIAQIRKWIQAGALNN